MDRYGITDVASALKYGFNSALLLFDRIVVADFRGVESLINEITNVDWNSPNLSRSDASLPGDLGWYFVGDYSEPPDEQDQLAWMRSDYANLERIISDIYYIVEQEAAVDPLPGLDYNSFVRSSSLVFDEEKFKIALQLKHRQQVASFNVHYRSSLTEVPDRFDRKNVVQFIFT